MEIQSADVESVTVSDILSLATWNRQRSTEELQSFISSRHAALPDDTDVE